MGVATTLNKALHYSPVRFSMRDSAMLSFYGNTAFEFAALTAAEEEVQVSFHLQQQKSTDFVYGNWQDSKWVYELLCPGKTVVFDWIEQQSNYHYSHEGGVV
ncbi:hypothetical protein POTOM_004619 [Populus tomentosa]|uniref:Uncharacterized protein n=1 Tax=Populus tomentosa TaxID=118781 RepID=A0A8X8AHP2_POPTO|nr:hypothetical protein POTOM_004619 [Populus tomentosa]